MAPKKIPKADKGGYGDRDNRREEEDDDDYQDPDACGSEEFNPHNRNTDLEKLTEKFLALTLRDQLTISQKFQNTKVELDKKMKVIPTPKQVLRNITAAENKANKTSKTKEVHERYKKVQAVIRINFNGKVIELAMYTNDRLGTLRQALARALGLKKSTVFAFTLNGEPLKKTSPTIFLYSLGFTDGMELGATIATDENDDDDGDESEEEEQEGFEDDVEQ